MSSLRNRVPSRKGPAQGRPSRVRARHTAALASTLSLASVLAPAAHAQSQLRYDDTKQYGAVTVNDTDRPLFKPDGLRMGNFIFSPEAG